MHIELYSDFSNKKNQSGPIVRFFKKLMNEHPPKFWLMVKETLEKVKKSSDLEVLKRQKWVRPLKHIKEPILEFRIPPSRRGGVVRLYFAYKKNDSNTIIILSAEKKKGSADKGQIAKAVARYKEVIK